MQNRQILKPIVVAMAVVTYLVATAFMSPADQTNPKKGVVCRPGITVMGSSNLQNFELRNNLSIVALKSCGKSTDTAALQKKKYWYQIPVKNFKTEHTQVYKDFLSLIKADEFPQIQIGITLADLHRMLGNVSPFSFPVEISMAGQVNSYQVTCSITSCTDNSVVVAGFQKMRLSDFSITPPEKFLGLIKVDDEFMVTFDFVLTAA